MLTTKTPRFLVNLKFSGNHGVFVVKAHILVEYPYQWNNSLIRVDWCYIFCSEYWHWKNNIKVELARICTLNEATCLTSIYGREIQLRGVSCESLCTPNSTYSVTHFIFSILYWEKRTLTSINSNYEVINIFLDISLQEEVYTGLQPLGVLLIVIERIKYTIFIGPQHMRVKDAGEFVAFNMNIFLLLLVDLIYLNKNNYSTVSLMQLNQNKNKFLLF